MHSPYTSHELEALTVAQTSVALTLTALVWARPVKPRAASIALLGAAWIAVFVPIDNETIQPFGIDAGPGHLRAMLRLSAVLAGVSGLLSRRVGLALTSLAGAVGLWCLRNCVPDSDWDVAGANLAVVGLLVGVHYATLPPARAATSREPSSPRRTFFRDDAVLFGAAVALGALVATYILERHTGSGDEWANTYQAAVFWKGRAYAAVPDCMEAFRSFWVYPYEGRSFAQYTPGWPLFMAPFVGLGVAWLAGPFSFAVLVVGVAQLSRRAALGLAVGANGSPWHEARVAGLFGGFAAMLGTGMLLNAGSRYPHVFVAAMYAWSVELLLRVAEPEIDVREQRNAGALLGTTSVLLLAARPGDGATLGVGLASFAVYALARRRIGWNAVLATLLAAAAWGGLTLVILRLQLGVWFKTGYSITEIFYPWNKIAFSVPKPDEIRAGIPLAAGSYCWWPCSPALGLAGVAALKGRARQLAWIFTASCVPLLAFYTFFEMLRQGDVGYGPRYQLPCVVPMAVGMAVMMTLLWRRARSRVEGLGAFAAGGPLALALLAVVFGLLRIAPYVYPTAYEDVREHNRLQTALATSKLHHAVVIGHEGVSSVNTKDLTENLPIDLYPDQDVLIAREDSADSEKCLRTEFADRTIVHARMHGGHVVFEPGSR